MPFQALLLRLLRLLRIRAARGYATARVLHSLFLAVVLRAQGWIGV